MKFQQMPLTSFSIYGGCGLADTWIIPTNLNGLREVVIYGPRFGAVQLLHQSHLTTLQSI